MVNGFGYASLRDRLLKLGATSAQLPELEAKVRAALSGGVLGHPQAAPSKAIAVIADAYASGLAGTMLVVALLVALLGAISLLLLVIGRQQGGAQV